jgi:AcrR family transcriptional regulator
MTKAADRPASPKGRGRPPRLTLERLLAGADEIGLDSLTMKSLAAHLGVGIATVYRFASSKEELVRMATVSRTKRPGFKEQDHQDWRQFATAFGQEMLKMYTDEPQLIALMISGGVGPEIEAPTLNHFLAALDRRGFNADSAMRLYYAIGALALGCAVVISHNRALRTVGRPRIDQLAEIAADAGYENIAQSLGPIANIEQDLGFNGALAILLEGYSHRNAAGAEIPNFN